MPGETVRRVCVLTGASGLLGTAFIERYADQFEIAAVYNRKPPKFSSQEIQLIEPHMIQHDDIARPRPSVFSIQANLYDDNSVDRIVELVATRFGRVDLLINSAVDIAYYGSLLDFMELEKKFMNQIKLTSFIPIKLAVAIARKFWRDRVEDNLKFNRNVINISSIAGLRIIPNKGQALYSGSKAALNYLTCHLAHEFKPIKVRANILAPTAFPSRIPSVKVAEAVARIDAAAYTGKVVWLDEKQEKVM